MADDNTGVDQYGDVVDSANNALSDLIDTGSRIGARLLNGYAGAYGDPGTLYPPGTIPINGAPVGYQAQTAAAKNSNPMALIVIAFLAWKFLR